jgi:hypothetical protein
MVHSQTDGHAAEILAAIQGGEGRGSQDRGENTVCYSPMYWRGREWPSQDGHPARLSMRPPRLRMRRKRHGCILRRRGHRPV